MFFVFLEGGGVGLVLGVSFLVLVCFVDIEGPLRMALGVEVEGLAIGSGYWAFGEV